MLIFRMAETLLDMDGRKVIKRESDNSWHLLNGDRLTLDELKEIYAFLDMERIAFRNKFNAYCDRVISQLLYPYMWN